MLHQPFFRALGRRCPSFHNPAATKSSSHCGAAMFEPGAAIRAGPNSPTATVRPYGATRSGRRSPRGSPARAIRPREDEWPYRAIRGGQTEGCRDRLGSDMIDVGPRSTGGRIDPESSQHVGFRQSPGDCSHPTRTTASTGPAALAAAPTPHPLPKSDSAPPTGGIR
jgi:hypothetical protein